MCVCPSKHLTRVPAKTVENSICCLYIFACTIITPSSRRLNFRLKKEIKKDQIFRVLGISEEETTNKEAETHTHINAESDKR